MFGDKHQKRQRLHRIGRIVRRSEEGVTQSALARMLGVSRATVYKDLALLQEETGILLAEDDTGRLYWFE